MAKRLKPFDVKQHEEMAEAIIEAINILDPYMVKIWEAYGVNSKEGRAFHTILKSLSGNMRNLLDNKFFDIPDSERQSENKDYVHSPYYKGNSVVWG